MLAGPRQQFNSVLSLAADVSLTILSDRIHRGSLANARAALDTRRERDLGSLRTWSEFQDRARRRGSALLPEVSPARSFAAF
ncbi:MAG: hypothetical protein ACT4P1_07120 [Sporichthyaceae bacterium]